MRSARLASGPAPPSGDALRTCRPAQRADDLGGDRLRVVPRPPRLRGRRRPTGPAVPASGARVHLQAVFPRVPVRASRSCCIGRGGLALTNPLLAVGVAGDGARRPAATWPAGTAARELHMLAPARLRARASNVPGHRRDARASGACLYARRVIIARPTATCARVMALIRLPRELRWAWLLEGAARWFGGQTALCASGDRAAPARGWRAGAIRFPPGLRDCPAARRHGDRPAGPRAGGARPPSALSCRLHPQGPRAALVEAFGGRSIVHTESTWRSHLSRLAAAP